MNVATVGLGFYRPVPGIRVNARNVLPMKSTGTQRNATSAGIKSRGGQVRKAGYALFAGITRI